jgi:glycosyltransferase involved in cell wall biosynthesis
MKAIHLSVIVPVFNEALTIGVTIRKLREFLQSQSYSWEIVICDDGSTDDTIDVFHREVSHTGCIRALLFSHRGKGATVRDGVISTSIITYHNLPGI